MWARARAEPRVSHPLLATCVPALDGRGMSQRRLPRAAVPRAAAARPARLRASKGAEARPAGAGRGACGPGPAFLGRESALNNYSPPICVRLMYRRPHDGPRPHVRVSFSLAPHPRRCGRANPENRILRKTQEVRQTIQDRLFKVAWGRTRPFTSPRLS